MNNTPLFFVDKPVFGIDISQTSVKVMQIDTASKMHTVRGYGHINFDDRAIKQGVVVDPETIAKAVYTLFSKHLVGAINTKRVISSVPSASTFNRILSLPHMEKKDLDEAVRLEAEQYIPVPLEDLYLDYEIVKKDDNNISVLMVGAPKKVIDSFMVLLDLLGLEVVGLQPSIDAVTKIIMHAEGTSVPTLIIDFGSYNSNMAIYDSTVSVAGSISSGGENISELISKSLNVTSRQAYTIKTRYGLDPSKRQKEIIGALSPYLKKLISEIKKIIRFYEERSVKGEKVGQVITVGGGANLPGLSTYLTDQLRLPARRCDPWQNLNFGTIQPPHPLETTLYTTAAGLSLAGPRGILS